MIRDISTPDGVSWRVEIDWIARRIRNPFRRSYEAARAQIDARKAARRARKEAKERGEKPKDSSWADCIDCPAGGDIDDLAVILLVIVAVVLLFFLVVWVAPVLWAILAVLFEFFFVTIAAVLILVWRVVLRRPWRVVARRVEAVDGEPAWSQEVVGYRPSRRRVREVADGLARGQSPADLGLNVTDPR